MNRILIYWLSQMVFLLIISIYSRWQHSASFHSSALLFSLLIIGFSASLGAFGFWLGTKNIKSALRTKAVLYLAAYPAIMSTVGASLAGGWGPEVATGFAVVILFVFSFLVGWKHEVYVPKRLRG